MTLSKTYRYSIDWEAYPFLILGGTEAILGLLQLAGICRSEHPDYPFTGSFYNPGPYACYLAVLLPMAVFAFRNTDHKLTSRMARWLGTGMVFACAILIPASLSRAAMIAAVVGSAVSLAVLRRSIGASTARVSNFSFCASLQVPSVEEGKNSSAPKFSERASQSNFLGIFPAKHRAIYIVGFLLMALVIAGGLYAVKKDSADGRLVMWKVAMQAAADVPLTGVGWDNVVGAYGDAQERYFESGHGSESETMVADAPEYVFNEYLQVAIAFGPLALLAMLLLMGLAFSSAFHSGAYGIAGSIAATALVMTASYPLQFPLFTVTIALILTMGFSASRFLTVEISGAILSALSCILFLTNSERTDVRTGFACGHALHRSRDYRKSNDILIPLMEKSADPMILNIIGKNYQSLSIPDSAEHYFRKSTFRCPNRMYPHYLLMLLYADSASFDRTKCLREAEVILSMPVKIHSPAVEEMKEKARAMINEASLDFP